MAMIQHTNAKRTSFVHCVAFIILISAVTINGEPCLSVCECSTENYVLADCSGRNLNKIPQNNNTTVFNMDLSNNNITEIQDSDLLGYKSIVILNLTNNGIKELNISTFNRLVNLTHLYLSGNQISLLSPYTFNSNQNLKSLYLKGNPLIVSTQGPFLVSDSITYLDIAFCNIVILPTESLSSLPRLEALRLDGNILTNITKEIFEPLKNLKEIYMEPKTPGCGKSSFHDILNYLNERKIAFYGPRLCSGESLSTVPITSELTVAVSASTTSNLTATPVTTSVPESPPRSYSSTLVVTAIKTLAVCVILLCVL